MTGLHGEPLIELDRAGVCYYRRRFLRRHPFWALHDVTFTVNRGETLGIIGHNGAGKSTLLRLLAGVIDADEGRLIRHTSHVSLLALNVGLVKYLSGRENAILGGLMLGLTRKEIDRRLPDIIDFSELGDFFEEPVQTYSAGMRARLGFSVALLNDPDILLIDEVLGVGDKDFKKKSSAVIRERIASEHTVVLVSHNADMLADMCDRLVWLEAGQVVAQGDVAEVLENYESNRLVVKQYAKDRMRDLNAGRKTQ